MSNTNANNAINERYLSHFTIGSRSRTSLFLGDASQIEAILEFLNRNQPAEEP